MNSTGFNKKSKLSSPHTDTIRLDLKLQEPDTTFFNSISYKTLAKTKHDGKYTFDDSDYTNDWLMEYEEDSYIDNTELYPDSFPSDKEPEFGGFFINYGKLKLKSTIQPMDQKKQVPLKKKTKKKIVQNDSFDGKVGVLPVCKKKVAKSDANAKLDAILLVLLKGRMKAQDPASNKLKQGSDINGDGAFRSAKNEKDVPVLKHAFVSHKPRMQLSFGKEQPKE